jgi:hypothetical protein
MKRWDTKKIIKLENNNEGVAGIIVAVMLIGIMFAFLSVVQLNYVPDWSEEREAEHMDTVSTQFTQLKFSVDLLSTVGVSGNKITTPITLGTQEIPLPFLRSDKSFGFLRVFSDECVVNITDTTPTTYSNTIGSIKYTSRNSNYVDVEFIYEAGGVITNQNLGNTMYVMPYFDVDYSSSVDITFDVVNFIESTGNTYTTGHGNIPIKLEYIATDTSPINNVNTITICSNYLLAWHNFLNDTLLDSGLSYGASDDFIIIENDEEITIDFNDALSVDITLRIIDIDIKIGPGWLDV